MTDALSGYRERLVMDIDRFERIVRAMESGEQHSYERDPNTGRDVEVTADRVKDFKQHIDTLKQVVASIDGTSDSGG